MSQPHLDPVVSTQYLQIKLPRDVKPSDNLASGCKGKDEENVSTTSNFVIDTSPPKCRSKGPSPVPSCISSTVINLMPSINTAPVSSESNCYFKTRDFLNEEAKQAAANLRDTMAAIADKRSMFFSECPKSPKHSLDTKLGQKVLTPVEQCCPSEQQPPLQRSSLILERNKDSHNFEVTSRDDDATLLSIARKHPRLTPERTMSGYYFPNLSRRPGSTGRISLKTFELIKNCPSLELYTTAPIAAMTATPPVILRPKISPPPLQVSPPPSMSLVSSKPIILEITDPTPAVATSHHSSPDKFLRISISPCNTTARRARSVSREDVPTCPGSEMLPLDPAPEQNGEHSPLPMADKPQKASTLHDVRFFSAPEAFPFQECDQDTEGRGSDDKITQPSGDDSLPSTPNSGSLSSSMRGSSINKLKSFFCDNMNVFEAKQGENTCETDTPQQKLSASEGTSRFEKGSFKVKKSNSKQQQLQVVPTTSQGSPGSKHKKSPTEKEPQQPKESWKGRVARTIKRYGSGSILLSSEPSPALTTPDDTKATKVVTLQPQGVFGVPLEVCEVSPNYELVPLVVEVCVRIVEEKGLDNQGIYRVPGNTGAIKELQDEINKDPKGLCLDSEKWQDVNLVTSLLKLFFRKLPDSLITDRLYEPVIATTRLEKSEKRMLKLKRILHDMPERNFNTFSLLAKHLNLVASHEEHNKMDAHNLAIMFGPTLVRPQDNNIAVMARNMADQCRVVEMIVMHCDWFFSSWDEDVHVPMDGESEESTPVIDEKMVAKAQSLGNACQKSSSSSSLHQLPSLVLSPSSSSISSLPLTSPTNWNVVMKKFNKFNLSARESHQLLDPRDRTYHPVALKSSSNDAVQLGKAPLFIPTSKKNFFSWVGKAWHQNKLLKSEFELAGRDLLLPREAPPSLSLASNDSLEGRVGTPLEIEVKVIRYDRYNLDGQSFALADNRDIPKLPWRRGEGSRLPQDHNHVFRSIP